MRIIDLIEKLQELDARGHQRAKIRLSIGNPKDTCFTDEVEVEQVTVQDGVCTIRGWVSSDNEGAFAPWAK